MAKPNLKLVSPAKEIRAVQLRRPPNRDLRPREHLTEREVEKLIEAAKGNRYGLRDSTMLRIAFRHGLRVSELSDLQWTQVEFETATLHVRRAKGGVTTTHPLMGDELRALRALKREAKSPFVFVSERGAPFTTAGFASLVERAGIEAKIGFKVHPHMLRHACGFVLANRGTDTRTLQAYLGHRSIQSTVRYAELAPGRFKNLWRDLAGGKARLALGLRGERQAPLAACRLLFALATHIAGGSPRAEPDTTSPEIVT